MKENKCLENNKKLEEKIKYLETQNQDYEEQVNSLSQELDSYKSKEQEQVRALEENKLKTALV